MTDLRTSWWAGAPQLSQVPPSLQLLATSCLGCSGRVASPRCGTEQYEFSRIPFPDFLLFKKTKKPYFTQKILQDIWRSLMFPQYLDNVAQFLPNVPNFPNVCPIFPMSAQCSQYQLNVQYVCQLSHMSAKCPQFLPNDLNICPMSPTSAHCCL